MRRACNQLAAKRCAECGRRGVKAFVRKTIGVAGYEIELWRCSNKGRCGERGFDLQAAMEETYEGFLKANPAEAVSTRG